MGTKGREIFSRDSLQSYTVKFFLSPDLFFFSSVNFFSCVCWFWKTVYNYQTNDFFHFLIRRAFCRSSFHRKIVIKKRKFLPIIYQPLFHKKDECMSKSVCLQNCVLKVWKSALVYTDLRYVIPVISISWRSNLTMNGVHLSVTLPMSCGIIAATNGMTFL